MKSLIFHVLALFLASCASQPEKITNTQWPQAVIKMGKEAVMDEFIAAYTKAGASIESATGSVVMMRFPDPNPELSKIMLGCGLCQDPYVKMNLIFAGVKEGTLVTGQYWRMIPQPNGSEMRVDSTNNADFNAIQEALWRVRDRLNADQK